MTAAGNNDAAAAPMHIETDVLVIGAGGAGMYAALEAARAGAASSTPGSCIGPEARPET